MLKFETLISPQLKPYLPSVSRGKSTALSYLEQRLTFPESGQ